MTLIKVNTDKQLFNAVKNSATNDIIELESDSYFTDSPATLPITHSLTITGRSPKAKSTINATFIIGSKPTKQTILILKNLSVDFTGDNITTIALYDNSQLYCHNVIVSANNDSKFDTIYCRDSAISLDNSVVLTNEYNSVGMSLENSQMTAVNSNFNTLGLKNSIVYLKDCLVNEYVGVLNKSSLSFSGLAIDSRSTENISDLYVEDESDLRGNDLSFAAPNPSISITNSNFDNVNFLSDINKIDWFYDDDSEVLANGQEPRNSNI